MNKKKSTKFSSDSIWSVEQATEDEFHSLMQARDFSEMELCIGIEVFSFIEKQHEIGAAVSALMVCLMNNTIALGYWSPIVTINSQFLFLFFSGKFQRQIFAATNFRHFVGIEIDLANRRATMHIRSLVMCSTVAGQHLSPETT